MTTNKESLIPCLAGRDYVEINQRECGIIAAALSSMLHAANDAKSDGYASEVQTLVRVFLGPASDSRVGRMQLFLFPENADFRLWKSPKA